MGQRRMSRGSELVSLSGESVLGLLFLLNTEIRNYGGYKALERKREAAWGKLEISEMGV